jgi:glutathione S-transferase
MVDLILTTFDWVPETRRGYVRDIRVGWALEEGRVALSRRESVPFGARDPTSCLTGCIDRGTLHQSSA